jgi:hypothetical protein
MAFAKALPAVRLIEAPGDCFIAVLVVAASALYRLNAFHLWRGFS